MNLLDYPFYGDQFRWFLGKVINNNDPDMLGRVQVRISGIHSNNQTDIPEHTLPWATVLNPGTEGGTSGIGKIPQILPGATVFGVFIDGKTSQVPLVLGSINQIERPSTIQTEQSNVNTRNTGSDGAVVRNDVLNSSKSPYNVDARRLVAMIFFTDNGYTATQAAAIVGNLEAESNFSTTVVSTFENESSQGIAQWNPAKAAGNRLEKLKIFAQNLNKNWRDYDVQLQFVMHELKGRPKNGDGGGAFSYVQKKLEKCTKFDGGTTPNNATWIICKYYEIPANAASKLAKRETYARKAYTQFMSSGSVS